MRLKTLMAALFSLCLIATSYGQGWERHYHVDTVPLAQSINHTTDGGFLLASKYLGIFSAPMKSYLVKTNVNGDTLWTKTYSFMTGLSSAKQTTDGGYILAGYDHLSYQGGVVSLLSSNIHLAKVDVNGDTVWTKTYANGGSAEYAFEVQQTTDGGYILAGATNGAGAGGKDAYLIKTDASGIVQWTQTYGGVGDEELYSVEQTTDGGYVSTGYITTTGAGAKDVYVVKTDANGLVQWTQTYGGVSDDEAEEIIQTIDGGYILTGYTRSFGASFYDIYVVKIDAVGTVEWTQMYGGGGYQQGSSIIEGIGGGYLLTAATNNGIYVSKLNTTGVIGWTKNFDYGQSSSGVEAVRVGNGYAVLGYTHYSNTAGKGYLDLLRIDSLGNTYTNYIKGNIFNDTSSNCLKEIGERNFEGIVVRAVGNNRTWYGTTDSLGNYCIQVDTGSYIVTSDLPLYWQMCANNVPITFSNFHTTDTIDFPFQAQVNCPMMQVDLSAPFIRTNGTGSNYYVNYCNNGTIDASNVYVEVTIDADLDVLSSSLSIASQVGNVLTFNIGDVAYGDCGVFYIQVRANTSAILGQTHCSEAHIFPDSLCLPAWGGGIIEAAVNCQNDSVAFKLENIGGNLFNSETYYVFEDHFIMRIGNTGNIPMGDSFTLVLPADTAKSYRISVAQNVGFPKFLGDTIASAAIEGCIPDLNGLFNIGFITQFSNGNSAPSIAVDCQQNRGSYDPNDKSAQPAGYDTQHYIYGYTDLDYKIRFQNTGTDTAFLVVIRDTISPLLDLNTLTMGASSHDYTWRVYGDRILEITFDNILLPDSTVNNLASNGFVRYRIEQQDGNVAGDVIYNAADIYFDFNAPIKTNQTYHTIGENFVTIILDQTKVLGEVIQVKVYPNPFTQNATLEVEGEEYNELQLTIYDVSGRVVLQKQAYSNNKIELSRGNLQSGVYLYQLLGDDALINTGKIIVQ
jgi:hypothetical protein